jgi:hypothetical protein
MNWAYGGTAVGIIHYRPSIPLTINRIDLDSNKKTFSSPKGRKGQQSLRGSTQLPHLFS